MVGGRHRLSKTRGQFWRQALGSTLILGAVATIAAATLAGRTPTHTVPPEPVPDLPPATRPTQPPATTPPTSRPPPPSTPPSTRSSPPRPRTPTSTRAPAPKTSTPTPAPRACPTGGFGGVKQHVAQAGHHLLGRYRITRILGVGSRANSASDHPLGLALDMFVDRATGDQLAAHVLANQQRMGASYVIWRQRINFGAGWKPMGDRGTDTANHFDHVHVSFNPIRVGPGLPC